ncbi:MAG TPA: TspO/MBR family protein [Allosphingosinicella sp.]|jgi:tryptophan-rich sensory protein|uniref:TspO/MBR family protein n=1 Tax=Allosphingosinicella sp. TaxID=2823234 RepID=UPI002F28CACE
MSGIASKSQLRMSYLRYALFTVPLILLLGTVSGRMANSGYDNAWFAALVKPALMPPAWMFGVAWTILYILLGLAIAIILNARGARGRGLAVGLFVAQMLLNFSWSPVFFGMHKVNTALLILVAMLLTAAATAFRFWRIRKNAALLMLPYLAWLTFATVLNYQIGQLNPDAENLVPSGGGTDIIL